MFTTKARKAYSAAVTAGIGSAIIAAPEGFTVVEWLTIAGVIFAAFQATYWTENAKVFDGALVVDKADPFKDQYSLEISTPLEELDNKSAITLKVIPPTIK